MNEIMIEWVRKRYATYLTVHDEMSLVLTNATRKEIELDRCLFKLKTSRMRPYDSGSRTGATESL